MRYFKFNKLVRDEIVYQILKSGDLPKYRYLEEDEFLKKLKAKMLEEVEELCNATKNKEMIEELADISELVDELMKLRNIKKKELKSCQINKKRKNGGFGKRIFIDYVGCKSNSTWARYYQENEDKYPEINM